MFFCKKNALQVRVLIYGASSDYVALNISAVCLLMADGICLEEMSSLNINWNKKNIIIKTSSHTAVSGSDGKKAVGRYCSRSI
jgi:hypothetical protein